MWCDLHSPAESPFPTVRMQFVWYDADIQSPSFLIGDLQKMPASDADGSAVRHLACHTADSYSLRARCM